MTQAVMELEARKASFVKRFLSEVNDESALDSMMYYLKVVLDNCGADDKPYSEEELLIRLRKSEEDIQAGRVYSMDEVTKEMETKYPWLCD